MRDLRIFGLPEGTTAIEASQGGQTVSGAVGTAEAVALATPPTQYIGQPVARWGGVSATIVNSASGPNWGAGFSPPVNRDRMIVSGVDGNRFFAGFNDSTYTADRWIGGRAEVYRVADGELVLVRSSQIVAGNFAVWHRLVGTTQAVDGLSFQRRFDGWNREAHTYHFGVAAVDAGLQAGTIGHVPYLLPTDATGETASNPGVVGLSGPWSPGGSLPAPTSIAVQPLVSGARTVQLSWDSAAGAVGYIPYLSYVDPASHPTQPYLELEDDGGAPVMPGDFVILTNRIMRPDTTMISPRVWDAFVEKSRVEGGRLAAQLNTIPGVSYAYRDFEAGDTVPEAGLGSSYVRFDVDPGTGQTPLFLSYWHAGAHQSFYTVLEVGATYRFSMWVRGDRTGEMAFSWDWFAPRQPVAVDTAWRKITFDLTWSEADVIVATDTRIRPWALFVDTSGEGALSLDIAAVQVERVGIPYGGFTQEDARLVAPGMFLRDHALIKDYPQTTDVESLTNPPGQSHRGPTLEGFLRICRQVRAKPWIQIEWYHRAEDWQDILAYLAAPLESGHPMALKRAANGREAPWTDAFDRILFEFGNEAWNSLTEFWTVWPLTDSVTEQNLSAGEVYGLICRRAALAMQSSPFWTDRIEWVLGGWSRQAFGADAARRFRLPCHVGIANYNGGWDEGTALAQENASSYQNVLAAVPSTLDAAIEDHVSRLRVVAEQPGSGFTLGRELKPTCYEAGPGYQLNGLNGASVSAAQRIQQEVVMKSRAAATATLDTTLAQARRGFELGNFFVLGSRGDTWQASAPESQGGGVFPSWQLLKIIEEEIGPSDVLTAHKVNDFTVSAETSGGETVELDGLFVHGLRSIERPDRVMIVVGNRDFQETRVPHICTAFASATVCTVWSNAGDPREHNRYPVGSRLTTRIVVDGDGQTGASLAIRDVSFVPALSDRFTLAGDATIYTVTDVAGWEQTSGTLGISPALSASPANGTTVTWDGTTGAFVPDTLSVDIRIEPQSVPVPPDLQHIVVDESLGTGPGGLGPGNCLLILLEGVT